MTRLFKRNKQSFVVAVVAAIVLGGGAYAAIPSADGTVTACTAANGTAVRLIDTDAGQACNAGEKKVAWNQKGDFTAATDYDHAKDSAGGYKVGDLVRMVNTTQCNSSDPRSLGGLFVKIKVHAWPYSMWPCKMGNDTAALADLGWKRISSDGQRGPTGMRGATGAPGPNYQHWAKFDADGNVVASSEPLAYSWGSGTGQALVQFTNVDLTKCAITVTPVSTEYGNEGAVHGTYSLYYNAQYLYARAYNAARTAFADVALDVIANCRS